MLPCAYKSLFGIDCPACGFQRSFWSLMEGNFIDSFELYPPLIPVLILIFIATAWLLKINFATTKLLKYTSIITLTIIMLSYIFKVFL
jgi:hypothetical protein